MTETFLIKNTANTTKLAIAPGTLNGPGGTKRNSDLLLYGLGVHDWGGGVDQNMYRLLETSACPAKNVAGYIFPQDETDLGPGNGITTPVDGQQWFNTDSNRPFVKTPFGWIETSGEHSSIIFTSDGVTTSDIKSNNVTSIVRNSQGVFTITFTYTAPVSTLSVYGDGHDSTSPVFFAIRSVSTTSVQVYFSRWNGSTVEAYDPTQANVRVMLNV